MRLEKHLPDFINKVLEYEEMDKTHTVDLDLLDSDILELQNNQFVYEANEKGLSRFEEMFDIVPVADIETRRLNILALYNSSIPFTYRWLVNFLNSYVGINMYTVSVDYATYSLNLSIVPSKLNLKDYLIAFLRKRIPANIGINVGELFPIDSNVYAGSIIRTADKQII